MGIVAPKMMSSQRPKPEASRAEGAAPLDPFFELSDDLLGLADMYSGRWTKTNPAFLKHLGYTAAELLGLRVSSFVHPDDHERCEEAARALAKGQRFGFESRMRAKDGDYRLIAWTLDPRPDLAVVYSLGRIKETIDDTQRALNATKSLEASRSFTFSWQRSGDSLDLDAAAQTLLGLNAFVLRSGRRYLDLIDASDREQLRLKIAATSKAAPQFHATYRIKARNDEVIWLEEAGRVIFSRDGRKCGIVGLCRDVTARKQADASTELVMNEMTHRAKNVLTVVQAVLQFTKADTVEAYASAIRHRVHALARVQGLLAGERSGVDLHSVIADEFEPFGGLDGTRLSADGPAVRIAPHALQTLILVIHELATNAAKYGALSVPQGRIFISWTLQPEGLALVWRETDGPATKPPSRKGFGHTLVTASLSHIGGMSHLEFKPEGLVCNLVIPEATLSHPRSR